MDITSVLAENEKLIAEAEEALFTAIELTSLIRSGVSQSPRDGGVQAISKLIDDLIEIRGRLLAQHSYLKAEPKLRS